MIKNKLKLTLLIVGLCVLSLFLLTSCGEEPETEIFVTSSNSPRLTYVQGQELDLSEGKLTLITDGKESEIPFTAEGVTVTGYNKDTLGSQTLTVTYMEKTAEITVNVIPRIRAENFETKYFVNGEFDKTRGKLLIARDNATTFSVNMNNDKVSLVSFDNSTAGEKQITVKYTEGANSYECSFKVNVYDIAEVTLKTPTKTAYFSHETKLDFAGGYLTVKSTEDGGLSKFVNIDSESVKVSGFDITAATKDNMKNPLKQPITIVYNDTYTVTYDIYITYSGVSIVNDLAALLKDIDWEAEDASVTPEQAEATIEAITEYYKLSKSQKAAVSQDVTELMVRAAAVVVITSYRNEFVNYSDIIKIGENSSIYFVSSSYEKTVAALDKFKNDEANLNVYADILRNISEDFPKVVVAQGKTVEEVVAVHSTETHEFIVGIFEHLIELYETLEKIPKDWTASDLKANESDILVAINTIKAEDYVEEGFSYIYNNILSPWREKDDYLDILYYYYIHVKNDAENLFDAMFEKVPLPGMMNEWYQAIAYAANEAQMMAKYADSSAYLHDVTGFMYYYHKMMEESEAIKNSGNQLYLDIYDALDIDYLNDVNARVEGYGYFYQCGSMLDSEAFMNLWDKYLTIVDIYVTDTLDKTKNDAEFRALIEAFSALSPSDLYGFVTSLHFLYDTSRGSVLVLEYNDNPMSMFIDMLGQYSLHVLNDDCEPIFKELLVAMESYSLFDIKDTAAEDFKTKMADVISKYNLLSTTDRENFNEYYGKAYEKYLNIYNALTTPIANLGEYADEFEELKTLVEKFNLVFDLYSSTEEGVEKDGALGLLIALYERAKAVYETISVTENKDVLAALYANMYEIDEATMSLDNAFFSLRAITVYNIMASGKLSYKFTEDGEDVIKRAWQLYEVCDADALFLDMVYALYSQFDETFPSVDKATMLSLMQKMRDLIENDIETVSTFCTLEGDTYYYEALREFVAAALSDSADEIGNLLIKAEIAYISYLFTDDTSYLDTFKGHMASVSEDYETAVTTAEDKEIVEAMYNYYLAIYNGLTTEA